MFLDNSKKKRYILPIQEDKFDTIKLIERLISLGNLQSSIENLTLGKHRSEGGLGHWNTFNQGLPYPNQKSLWSRLQRKIYEVPFIDDFVHISNVAIALFQISGCGNPKIRGSLDIFQALTQILMAPKSNLGGDGSDQVRFLVNFLSGCHQISNSPIIKNSALWGIALQANLAYFFSGFTKIA